MSDNKTRLPGSYLPDDDSNENTVQVSKGDGDSNDPITADISDAAKEALEKHEANSPADTLKVEVPNFTDGMALRIEIDGSTEPVMLDISGEIVIGRNDKKAQFTAGLDLTPYGAYQMGLSRKHAILQRLRNELWLRDLGSRNGTSVNGQRLTTNEPRKLNDGDEIHIGKMRMHLFFAEK